MLTIVLGLLTVILVQLGLNITLAVKWRNTKDSRDYWRGDANYWRDQYADIWEQEYGTPE